MGQHLQAVIEIDRATPSLSQFEADILYVMQDRDRASPMALIEALSASPNTVYSALRRMLHKGFLVCEKQPRYRGRALCFYRMTALGQRMLSASKAAASKLEEDDYSCDFRAPVCPLPPEKF